MSKLLTLEQLHERGIPWTRQSIFRLVEQKKFPAPIKLNIAPTGAIVWLEDEIDAWLATRIAERDAKHGGPAA